MMRQYRHVKAVVMAALLLAAMTACDYPTYDYPLNFTVVNETDEDMLYWVSTVSATVTNGRFYDWYLPDTLTMMKPLPAGATVEEESEMTVEWYQHSDQNAMVVLFYKPATISGHTRRELIDSVIIDQAQFINRRNLHLDRSVHYTGRGGDSLFVKKPWREVE